MKRAWNSLMRAAPWWEAECIASIAGAVEAPRIVVAMITLALAMVATALAQTPPPGGSFLIVGARIADGTGAPLRRADVRIENGRIVEVGEIKPRRGELTTNAKNLVLAPGFIDVHNHSTTGLAREPLAVSQISQGITTLLVGQDGSSPLPIGEYLDARRNAPAAVNVATCIGHASVRSRVMGEDYKRVATAHEIERMEALVDQGFKDGALCLSSGLEYEVGGYATVEEVIALARVAAKHRGFYISHIRDEADLSLEAMTELVAIGERAGVAVQNTHVKVGTVGVWGKAKDALRIFDSARRRGLDITADCYPWDAWSSTILVLVPNKKYDDPASVARGLADVGGASNVLITSYAVDRSYEFKTMTEIAAARGITPVDLFIEIARNGGASVVAKSMRDDDIRAFYSWPWTMVSSDGGIGYRHPRGAGTFPRVLGRFVRERGWLTLEEAIRKMTSLPAARLGLADRGTIAPGQVADLVLFDPRTVIDNATFTEPFRLSTGIDKVWVSGESVWEGQPTGARPGRVLSRKP
jgi:N-acyl-D-amino-acid deacylase